MIEYEVKSGDTLSKIAGKFGVSWQELCDYNEIENCDLIQVGQFLEIPEQGGIEETIDSANLPQGVLETTFAPKKSNAVMLAVLAGIGVVVIAFFYSGKKRSSVRA